MIDLVAYRNTERDKSRVADLMRLLPANISSVLDIGARDGFVSLRLAEAIPSVTSLDLVKPSIRHDKIKCVTGDVCGMEFNDNAFDLVFCAEVLEHIPATLLGNACDELRRVSCRYILIGVPYMQDLRVSRTTCVTCGKVNPPWGHVNSFDEPRLRELFPDCEIVDKSFVGKVKQRTNFVACYLMDLAGNPYGTYAQDEPCIHCGATIEPPHERTFLQKLITKSAFLAQQIQAPFVEAQPIWMHVLLEKKKVARPV
jgi:SAM-dependent methyltransferase